VPVPVKGGKQPESLKNKPVDTSVCSLFDTAYTHPILQRSQLPWFVYDRWVKGIHYFISGTPEGPDQWVGQMSNDRKNLDSSKLSSLCFCSSSTTLAHIFSLPLQVQQGFTLHERRTSLRLMVP
jgi:dimethylaniline monooxygenase (N-oxide forming)